MLPILANQEQLRSFIELLLCNYVQQRTTYFCDRLNLEGV